ncbi:tyrosine-type recombinase/integrase [bacterium]|nr:tyrosine-type recombinase/integrase [bacterium]
MASLSQDKGRKGFRLSFYGLDKRKRSMWLGGFSRRQATTVKTNVEHLLVARAAGDTPDVHVARWLGSIGPDLRKKLITAELIEATAEDRGPVTLGPFLERYVASRKDVKDSTQATYRKTVTALVSYFGAGRRLDSITAGDAEMWRVEQATNGNQRDRERTEMEENSVRRRVGLARQFFRHAVKRKLIAANPFDGLPAAVRGNAKRQQFISAETIYAALEHATCPELRAVIALSRFAGVRVPSEIVSLTWQDVDLEASRLTIQASKTEHHEDGGLRFCPIFPELRPFLQALYDTANPGIDCPLSAPVITRWRSADQNIGTAFRKLLKRAGIKPWPKPFHNLRASRQTELLAEFPVKDVCEWIGNSQPVAMKHYAMATDDSFQRAICGSTRGSTGGSIWANQGESEADAQNEKPSKTRVSEGFRDLEISKSLGPAGLEPATNGL